MSLHNVRACPPLEQEPVGADTNGGTLLFSQECAQLSPELFGLNTFNIRFTRSVDGSTGYTTVTGTFNNGIPGAPQFRVSVDPMGEGFTATTDSPSISFLTPSVGQTLIVLYSDDAGNILRYDLSFDSEVGFLTSVEGRIFLPISYVITLPEVDGCEPIPGFIYLSHDGKNVCQISFTVQSKPAACRKNKCTVIVETTPASQFTSYCLDLQCVLRGKGCTLREQVDYIEARGVNIDFDTFVQYSVLRLILSMVLFGKFDVDFLRREFYEDFLCKLGESNYACYGDYFSTSQYGVEKYWKFFSE